MKNYAIIIPTYNEEKNIFRLVSEINNNIKNSEIFIIDDSEINQLDNKFLNITNVNIFHRKKKLGRGSAVLFGLRESLKKNFDLFVEMDADFSHNPNELISKIDFFEKNQLDLLISSKHLKNSKVINHGFIRMIFSKLSNWLAKSLLKIPVSDYTNGYRFYSRRSASLIVNKCGKIGDGFIVLSEILLVNYLHNYKIAEKETIFVNRAVGKSSVNFKLIFFSLIGLIKLFINKNNYKKSNHSTQ